MTDTQFLRVLSIALRILRRSRHGTRPRLKRRERAVLGILMDLSLTRRIPEAYADIHEDFDYLISMATWEAVGSHGRALPRFHKYLRVYLNHRNPGEETNLYLSLILLGVQHIVEGEGLYIANSPRRKA